MEKICLFCKNFKYEPGEPGYSDVTPGSDLEVGCYLGYWELDAWGGDGVTSYREHQLKAQSCPDFELVDFEALGIKV